MKTLYLSWGVVLSVLMALLAACGGGGSSSPSAPDFTVNVYEYPVYITGDLNDSPLRPVLETAFPGMVRLGDTQTNRPLFLFNPQLPLTDDLIAAITTAKSHFRSIVLFNVFPEQINAVLAIVGEPADYALPEGLDETIKTAESFAIDYEEDGLVSRWDFFVPALAKDSADEIIWEDNNASRARRIDLFIDWINADGNRSALLEAGQKNAQRTLSAKAGDNNLIDLSPPYMTVRNFADRDDLFQITHNAWTCHSFSEVDGVDYDWLYVEQNFQLRSGNNYKRRTGHKHFSGEALFGNDYDILEYYVDDYWSYSAFDDNAASRNYVLLMDSSPKNANNVTSVTEGISYNFGGSVGFAGKGATGSVSAGVTISNSKSFEVADAAIENQSMGGTGHDARWKFTFKKPEGYRSGPTTLASFKLHDAPLLARGLFQPSASWLWRLDPRQRDIEARFHTQFGVDYGGAQGEPGAFNLSPHQSYYSMGYSWWGYRVNYQNPPLIVLPQNIDFNNQGSYKTVDLAVSRNWTVSCDQPWCSVTPTSGNRNNTRINVTVDPNTTGSDRTAAVTAKTADGKDQMSMTVFQSRY
jgi:hypothetical protein